MKIESRYKTKTIILWSVILTVVIFLAAVLTSEMAYLTNDDGGIQNALSGYTTGKPYPYHQFISVILSFPIAGLYSIFPGIQWWYVWSLLAMGIGIFLVQYCFLQIANNKNRSMIAAFGIIIFLDIGFFVYPIANVSYTIVPAILGTGLVAGLLLLSDKDSIKHKGWIFFGITIGYILLLSHRRLTGFVILCYILLAFLYYYVNRSKDMKTAVLKFIGTAGVFLLITAALTSFNSTVQDNHNGEDFVAFNSARMQFIDHPHDTYRENPELYEEVDWDEDTYNLVTRWCFLNENVTTESLSYISENNTYTTVSTNVVTALKQIYHDQKCVSIFLLYAASIIIAVLMMIQDFNIKNLLFLLLNNGGTGILILYQIINGRALYRSIIIVLLPAVVINVIISIQNSEQKASNKIFYVCLVILSLICVVPMLSATFDEDRKISVVNTKEKNADVEEYLANHQKDFFVRETTGITDDIIPGQMTTRVSNIMGWGGSSWYSAIYYDQLEANGLSELTEGVFKRQNVYFISKTNTLDESYHDDGSDAFAMLYRKLQEDCDALGFAMIDTITDGAYVYHFVFDENEMIYNSYYDIVDGYTVKVQ